MEECPPVSKPRRPLPSTPPPLRWRKRRPRYTSSSPPANIKSFNKGIKQMFSRRGFIRVGAATVGSLALRPFGLLPALAQSGPDYRALVCVFLFGGNDSNNTVIPQDSYTAYQSIRGSLGLATSALTPVTSVTGAPYG